MYLDVEIEFILRYFHPNDITYFMHWYYSLGEFIRFTIAYYLYDEESLEKDREKYLSMASEPELKWFNENYADKAPLLQVIYIRLIYEIENRKNRGLHGSNKAAEGLLTAIQKLAVKAKVSPEEFFAKKIYPILANIRNRRIRQFYRLYTGKKLKK